MGRIVPAFTALTAFAVVLFGTAGNGAVVAKPKVTSPIRHVVILYQENHSFNDLLGQLCISESNRCTGTDTGHISNGQSVHLSPKGTSRRQSGTNPPTRSPRSTAGR